MSCHILLLLLLLVPATLSSCHCDFPAIINLGDSNSDTGGCSAAFGPAALPNGETFFQKPTGRFCDGRLMIDFISERFGFPYLSAYLDSVGANFSYGANFATAASTILPQNKSVLQGGFSPFSLDVQVRQLLQFKSRTEYKYFSRALYTLDIGHNDITQAYLANQSPEFILDAINRFSAAVKTIYNEIGGRSFWIHNAGPIGCLASILATPSLSPKLDPVGCGVVANELSQQFNRMLNETVVQLRKDLPLAALTYIDVYSAKYTLISQAEKHGFEQPLTACCGFGGGEYNVNSMVTCGSLPQLLNDTLVQAESCQEPLKRINWDGDHYTEAGNRWVFDRISSGAFSCPTVPLEMACWRHAPRLRMKGLHNGSKVIGKIQELFVWCFKRFRFLLSMYK